MQGFLNAVVYGWTRKTFVRTLVNGPGGSFSQAQREYEGMNKSKFEPEENSDIEPEQISARV